MDVSVEQVDGAVCVIGMCRGVRHHDDRSAFPVQRAQQFHHLLAVHRVEVARRLVGEDQRLVTHDRARNRNPLLLSARQLTRHVFRTVRDTHPVHYLLDALPALRRRHIVIEQGEFDVFRDIQFVDQVKALEDEADVHLANLTALRF